MQVIYKYELSMYGKTELQLPIGAEIRFIAGIDTRCQIWVEQDISMPCETRTFYVFATGQPIPAGLTFRGTLLLPAVGMTFVYHVYEDISL